MSDPTSTPSTGKPTMRGWPENPTMKTYSGACHCRKFQFEIDHPVFEDGQNPVSTCNCSICTNTGLLAIYAADDAIRFTSGSWAEATAYKFNTGVISHYFCPVCGVQFGGKGMGMLALNVRSLEGIDIEKLSLKPFDGKNLM